MFYKWTRKFSRSRCRIDLMIELNVSNIWNCITFLKCVTKLCWYTVTFSCHLLHKVITKPTTRYRQPMLSIIKIITKVLTLIHICIPQTANLCINIFLLVMLINLKSPSHSHHVLSSVSINKKGKKINLEMHPSFIIWSSSNIFV